MKINGDDPKVIEQLIKILIGNQSDAKIGSEGDYEQIKCIHSEDFADVALEIATFIQSITDPENQPNQYGITTIEKEKPCMPDNIENKQEHIEYLLTIHGTSKKEVIILTDAEIQSGSNRQDHAELLIMQLPIEHEGRNTWLLNYGKGLEGEERRKRKGVDWNPTTDSAHTVGN